MNLAKRKYTDHKMGARSKGIEFNISFEDWYNWWLSYGVDKNLPSTYTPGHRNMPCMCRKNDIGPYQLDNIYFDTSSNNVSFRNKNNPNFLNKRIKTPSGIFDSRNQAASAEGVSTNTISKRIKTRPAEYHYI